MHRVAWENESLWYLPLNRSNNLKCNICFQVGAFIDMVFGAKSQMKGSHMF